MAKLDLIKQLLKEKGITIQNLADCVKISNQGMQRIINDGSTTIERLEKIAKCLDVPVSFFFPDDPNERINFNESDYTRINEMIKISNLNEYKDQILHAFSFYDTKGNYISKHGVISEIFARFEIKRELDKKISEKDRLISIFQNTIEDLQKR